MIRVLIWNENIHEMEMPEVRAIYPDGIHGAIADFLKCDDIETDFATFHDDEMCGISKERLAKTDVLIYWAHASHKRVPDEVAELIRDAVHEGMGVIFLHSAHLSKPFRLLMGTPGTLCWRETGDSETLWVIEPSHPITRGIDRYFTIPKVETYGEPFFIPTPDKLLLIGNYSSGEVFRAGCLFERGNGKVFYFQPGHETYPIYHQPEVQTVIRNAVRFLAPTYRHPVECPHVRKITDKDSYVI